MCVRAFRATPQSPQHQSAAPSLAVRYGLAHPSRVGFLFSDAARGSPPAASNHQAAHRGGFSFVRSAGHGVDYALQISTALLTNKLALRYILTDTQRTTPKRRRDVGVARPSKPVRADHPPVAALFCGAMGLRSSRGSPPRSFKSCSAPMLLAPPVGPPPAIAPAGMAAALRVEVHPRPVRQSAVDG